MLGRPIGGLVLLVLGLSAAAPGAERATLGVPSAAAALGAPLADAAEQRDRARVRTLLKTGVDVNAAQIDGTTALHWAAYHDDAETAALLVRAGANVNAVNRYGLPPLSVACSSGSGGVVTLLLAAGADANAAMKSGETVLMLAARSGNLEAVNALLARGARHDARERRGQTALMWAAAEGHTAVVRALIDAGADINATLDSGFTPFFFAVREGHIDVVRAFLGAGVDVNATLQRHERESGSSALYKPVGKGTSPLLLAVQNGHFELAIALVDAGADPNDRRTGFTPLQREIVKRGANINLRLDKGAPKVPNTSSRVGTEGATAFLLAADRSDVGLMRLLVELGADPLLPNFNNTTPLMMAAGLETTEPLEEAGEEPEAIEAVKMLLDLGADINAVDNNGDTAMHGAAYNNYPLVVKLLADRGANPQIWKQPNKQGVTPLFAAEGHIGRLPRPDPATIDAVTRLMRVAGLSTEGQRPAIKDIYEKTAEPPKKPVKPEKP